MLESHSINIIPKWKKKTVWAACPTRTLGDGHAVCLIGGGVGKPISVTGCLVELAVTAD